MRKLLLMTVVILIWAWATAGVASADNGPHGGYTPATDACAGCHRAHTAIGPQLLVELTTYDLCMTCHGSSATGAVTNVYDGVLEAAAGSNLGTPLNGGGFVNYHATGITSAHDVSNTITDAWGNGVDRGMEAAMAGGQGLDCASCHDPHGSTNYRILKLTVNGQAVTVTQVDEGAQIYDSEQWPANISNICAACHGAYHETAANVGSDTAGQIYGGGYTHRVDMAYNAGAYTGHPNPETTPLGGYTLPLADSGGGNLVACSTCHLSHGSSAAMSGYADGGPTGSGTLPGNTTAADSALLRLDNRAVCEVCHRK